MKTRVVFVPCVHGQGHESLGATEQRVLPQAIALRRFRYLSSIQAITPFPTPIPLGPLFSPVRASSPLPSIPLFLPPPLPSQGDIGSLKDMDITDLNLSGCYNLTGE